MTINKNTTYVDVNYLLKAVNDMFPTVNITQFDIQSSWSGLRPLIHQEGKDPSNLSRKDEVFISASGSTKNRLSRVSESSEDNNSGKLRPGKSQRGGRHGASH